MKIVGKVSSFAYYFIASIINIGKKLAKKSTGVF